MGFDAQRFCRDYHLPTYTAGKNVRPGWLHIQCPIPGCGDHSNHGGFSPSGNKYVCWKCGSHGIPWVVSAIAHVSPHEARKILEEYDDGVAYVPTGEARKHGGRTGTLPLPGGELSPAAIRYLRGRGFDPYILEDRYGILSTDHTGYWESGLDFRWRIIIPIYDHEGRLVNFQGRDYTGKQELRYKGCPIERAIVHHKEILYGEEHCISTDHIAVVEGVLDQWRMGPGFVATFGTSLTQYQIRRLAQYRRVSFLFDPEPEAQGRAHGVGVELAALGVEVELVQADLGVNAKGEARDPGDLTEEEASGVRSAIFA